MEEGDLAFEEAEFDKAMTSYKAAAAADPAYPKAWKGMFRAGQSLRDSAAMKAAAQGYLRAEPDAPDAAQMRKALDNAR